MHNYIIKTIFLALIFIINSSWATAPDESNTSYWECSAHDSESKQWDIRSIYERVASTKAFDACKKQSNVPLSCKTTRESCDYFAHGTSTRPMWQCTALDQKAKAWLGNVYTNKDDAALGAKAYCQEKSTVPDSCYINFITCKNLNERP